MFWWDGFVQIREITFWRGMSVHLIIYEATRDITFSLFQRKFHKQTNKVICITIDHVEVMCSLVFTPQRIKLKTNGHYFQFGSTVVNFFSFVSLFSTNATFQCHHICTILLNKATPCFLHHSTISKGLLIQKLEHTYTIASSSWAVVYIVCFWAGRRFDIYLLHWSPGYWPCDDYTLHITSNILPCRAHLKLKESDRKATRSFR